MLNSLDTEFFRFGLNLICPLVLLRVQNVGLCVESMGDNRGKDAVLAIFG